MSADFAEKKNIEKKSNTITNGLLRSVITIYNTFLRYKLLVKNNFLSDYRIVIPAYGQNNFKDH